MGVRSGGDFLEYGRALLLLLPSGQQLSLLFNTHSIRICQRVCLFQRMSVTSHLHLFVFWSVLASVIQLTMTDGHK